MNRQSVFGFCGAGVESIDVPVDGNFRISVGKLKNYLSWVSVQFAWNQHAGIRPWIDKTHELLIIGRDAVASVWRQRSEGDVSVPIEVFFQRRQYEPRL